MAALSPMDALMKLQQIRNATLVIELGGQRLLVDPMLAGKGALPPLRLLHGLRRNPVVGLPDVADSALHGVTHCLITHCQKGHFDHLDRAGKRWLRERAVPVICTPHDAPHLRARGLNVQALPEAHGQPTPFLGGRIRSVRCRHGRGLVGRFMEHGVGYLIEMPGEPSLYLAGDTVLTDEVREFVATQQPDVCVIPAGGARFDIGGEIIMGVEEALAFTRISTGIVVANHLEALSHCPVSRTALAAAAAAAGLSARLRIPADGEVLELRAPC